MPHPFPNVPLGQRGRVICRSFDSGLLADNPWADPTQRDVYLYLPPGYDQGTRRYPAVLLLAGFSGTGEGMLSRGLTDVGIARRIDRLIAEGCPPFVAVLADGMSSLGGTQYIDSAGIGAYASWLVSELRPFVDGAVRTTGRWGVAGKSSGGFGALHLAMAHPGAFAAAACHSGDMGFELAYLADIPKALPALQAAGGGRAFVEAFWQQRRPSGAAFAALNLLCMAAAYAPEGRTGSPGFPAPLPIDLVTGEIDFELYRSWARFDPVVRVRAAENQAALAALDLLYVDVGSRDEYLLHLGARRFAADLAIAGVAHHYEEFDGGHRGTSWRYDTSLPMMARALEG